MTLDEILDCSADKLEAMTDEELISYLSPFFNVTRPELVQRQTGVHKVPQIDPRVQHNLKTLSGLGLDLTGLLSRKKKK